MKPEYNRDKLKLIKLLAILNMLQQPNCIININKTSKKNTTKVKIKNKKLNNQELNNQEVIIEDDSGLTLPIEQITINDDSKLILPICDKLSMAKFLIILKNVQQSYYNEKINRIFQNSSIDIKHENTVTPNKLILIRNSKDKLNTKYIMTTQEAIIKDDMECINKKEESNINNNDIYTIHKNINTDYCESLTSTLPIIIAEKNIDIPIESTFRLKNAALDIKNIKKDIYLTSSKLLPMYEKDDILPSLNGKLFLEGFVRNKLDFSVAKGVYDGIINLDTECVIIYIPFKCTTLINCKVPPVFSKGKGLDYIPIYISSDCLNINNDFNQYLSEKDNQCSEYVNCDTKPINCKIEEVKIYETHTLVDRKSFNEKFPLEMNFHTIKESIVLNLSLTLIQKQDIVINYRKNSK
ncbi:hypothetical protein KPL37_01860 [Clostridium frigoris]|uniref:DUF7852 domain-containing protein n=1 Tax=Clostridium frigoris TaxID=205327 RepID=A0ABS6BNL8_9CLOT|nr:hypothetical protein [Clostridium frigoris]MBU3158516.1 hypothetical protein [Clostridium frigoris]